MKVDMRRGKFFISRKNLVQYPKVVKQIMGQCIIIRAEDMYAYNVIEYQAISDWFDEVPEGMLIPEYDLNFTYVDRSVKWMFSKRE